MQHAVSLAIDGIAGVKPFAAPRRGGRGVVVEVTREKTAPRRCHRMAYEHFAVLAVAHVTLRVIYDTHLESRVRPSECTRSHLARLHGVAQRTHHLGHPPELHERKTETFLERPVQLWLDTRAQSEAHAVLAVIIAG